MASQTRILEAARGEFALHGYSARLQDIASRAGLTHPTLLYHFKSKELLYAAVIEDAMHDWASMTSAAVSAAPGSRTRWPSTCGRSWSGGSHSCGARSRRGDCASTTRSS